MASIVGVRTGCVTHIDPVSGLSVTECPTTVPVSSVGIRNITPGASVPRAAGAIGGIRVPGTPAATNPACVEAKAALATINANIAEVQAKDRADKKVISDRTKTEMAGLVAERNTLAAANPGCLSGRPRVYVSNMG
jgi:hypothetical protein